jgi:hypothetical protein
VRYAILIYDETTADPTAAPPPDPEVWDQVMADYNAYSDMLRSNGHHVAAEALQPVTTATTVRVRDGQTLTTDGPFAETKEALGGFYLVEAADLDEAIAYAAMIPGAQHGSIEVRPIFEWSAEVAEAGVGASASPN